MVFAPILKKFQRRSDYITIDLSKSTLRQDRVDIQNSADLKTYIQNKLMSKSSKVAYGGYLEKRDLYNKVGRFNTNYNQRDIHLGYDFWANAGEIIISPLSGRVHSFSNNDDLGNYGPTIILEHKLQENTVYSLYGHLSLKSISNIVVGQEIQKGEAFAEIGRSDVNGGYLPHLHFQIIKYLEGYSGDYPGVCHQSNLDFYKQNTLNPNLFLGI